MKMAVGFGVLIILASVLGGTAVWNLMVGLLLAVIPGIVIALFTTRKITRPLIKAVGHADRKENFDLAIGVDGSGTIFIKSAMDAEATRNAVDGKTMRTSRVPAIQCTAQPVRKVCAATDEQNAGADLINRAIQEMDHVIRQNAPAPASESVQPGPSRGKPPTSPGVAGVTRIRDAREGESEASPGVLNR